jgi:hypothetical protein
VVHVDVAGPAQPARPLVLAVPPPVAALDRLVERSCRREQLQRVLDVSVVDVRIPRDGDRVDARLRVDVTPGTGALTLTSVDGSVMFALELLDTATLQPGGSATVPLRIRPGRCDPHAFLESKRSFLFTAYVRPAAGEASYLVFELDDVTTQARLTAWARERCGL